MAVASIAAGQDTLWSRTYGTVEDELCLSHDLTDDGGFIMCGSTGTLYPNGDLWLVRADEDGDTIWTATYGWVGTGEYAWDVIRSGDGGFLAAGSIRQSELAIDGWILKLNQYGDTTWTLIYQRNDVAEFRCVERTSDGGYVLAGFTATEFPESLLVLKLDAAGSEDWSTTWYASPVRVRPYDIKQTIDGGYIIAGQVGFVEYSDVYALRLDADGDFVWQKSYGGFLTDWGFAVDVVDDTLFAVAGYADDQVGCCADVWLLLLDQSGDTLWTRKYGDELLGEWGISMAHDLDGGFIITGWTDNGYDLGILKTDASGETEWTRTYGGGGSEYGRSVKVMGQGTYSIAGYTNSFGAGNNDFYLLKVGTAPSYIAGDADGSGTVDIDDVVFLIAYIFSGGPEPVPYAAGDADCSGAVDIDDVVYLIAYIFSGGPEPGDPDDDGTPDC